MTATLEPQVEPASTSSTHSQRSCSQCQHPLEAETSVCSGCGYYETLGTYVDVSSDVDEEEEFKLDYRWLWIPAVCLLILIESVAAVFLTHVESPDRMLWSLSQLLIGAIIFTIAQFRAQIRSMKRDAATGIAAVIFHPFWIWRFDVKEFPKSLRWLIAGSAGLTAVLCSALIIRGLPSPFSEKFPEQKKMVMRMVTGSDSSSVSSLEEAVEEAAFLVEEGVAIAEEEENKKRVYTDCVVLGYNLGEDGAVSSLILATRADDKWEMINNVSLGLNEEDRAALAQKFDQHRRKSPLLDTDLKSNWVDGKFFCQVWFNEKETGERFNVHFDRMLLTK